MTSLYQPSREQLTSLLHGEPRYRLDQIWQGLYQQYSAPAEMTNLPKALRAKLAEALTPALQVVVRRVSDGGDTVKYLWELHDGRRIETVLMLYPDRVTVCVSSQVGCAMGCGFCATGQAGFGRHLAVGE
ncbi:MAG: 23S rRNA (adenine(2503)-C(2))-methyltransferase RlmN, partial [Ilumatobacteraceae bacterium]